MALLRKVKSATLIEALVATVLIVIVFVVASLILNNLITNTFSRNIHAVETRMAELEYLARHNSIKLPYKEDFGRWNIELEFENQTLENTIWLVSHAVNTDNKKTVTKSRIYAGQ